MCEPLHRGAAVRRASAFARQRQLERAVVAHRLGEGAVDEGAALVDLADRVEVEREEQYLVCEDDTRERIRTFADESAGFRFDFLPACSKGLS